MILDRIRQALSGNQGFAWPGRYTGAGSIYSDFQRVANYNRYMNVYYGRFVAAYPTEFDTTVTWADEAITTANVASRTVDALHSAVWVNAPEPSSDDERFNLFADEILEDTRVKMSISDSIRDTILHGDGVLKVTVKDGKIKVHNIHPGLYFPELVQPYPQEPTNHNIVFAEDPTNLTWYIKERYWLNPDTQTYWMTTTKFNATSGLETNPIDNIDLKIKFSPIIHTFSNRISGIFWGKAPLRDCEREVVEYANSVLKLSKITDRASTKALLTAPSDAFDERGNLIWNTERPYIVDDLGTFDKNKIGWVNGPGMEVMTPILAQMDSLEKDVLSSFGITKAIYGDTGSMRDISAPGLERVNLIMNFTVNRYQQAYNIFLTDLVNVAGAYARVWLGADLPEEYEALDFEWPDFAPESESERVDTLVKKVVSLGYPKSKALQDLGYPNGEELIQLANDEAANSFPLPHSPYDPDSPDPEIEEAVDNLLV